MKSENAKEASKMVVKLGTVMRKLTQEELDEVAHMFQDEVEHIYGMNERFI